MKFVLRNESWKLRLPIFLFLSLCVLLPAIGQNETSNDTIASQSSSNRYSGTRNLLLKRQDATTLLQSVTSVSGDNLLHRPVFQMESTFDGTLPGLVISPSSGYSTSQSSISLRGRSVLIVVDGIPRSDANIPVSQIESVSVIKDGLGLAAMGTSSGNGVLYITTKKGGVHPMRIELTAQGAFKQQMHRAEFLNSYEYGTLLNEALANDGLGSMYSDMDLGMYRTGANPFTHPDVDWYDVLTRKTAPVTQYNLNISGGTKIARYFVDLNVYDEQGFLKQDNSLNSYSTRESFEKYSLRANTDINVTPNTLLNVNVFGQMFRETTPGTAVMGTIYPSIHATPNNAYPVFNPDGSLGGNGFYPNNMWGQLVHAGYYLYPKTDFNIDATLEHRFKDALEGLYLSATYSYNSSYRESLNRSKNFETFSYWKEPGDTGSDTQANYTRLTNTGAQNNSYGYSRQNRMQYLQLSAGYDFSVNQNNIRTKTSYLYNDYTVYGFILPLIKNGFNLSAEYDYDKKYLAEFALSGMSLNQLHPDGRWGYFPTAGIGWNLTEEDWFKDADSKIDLLKLRMTYGLNGSDGSGAYYRAASGMFSNYYFTYIKRYLNAGSVTMGASPSGNNILVEAALPYNSKWERINRLNLGVDIQAFDKKFQGSVEFFHNTYSDLLMAGKITFNGLVGGTLIDVVNIGKYRQSGVEMVVHYDDRIGNVNISMNANATIHQTKLLADGGLIYPEAHMSPIGQPYGMIFGHAADGLFQNQAEIDAYLQTTQIPDYLPQPGDIRYKDINGDGILDGKDIQAIGSKAPRIEYGFFLEAEWRGISITSQWAGMANRNLIIQDMPFELSAGLYSGYGQALVEHLDRWSPDNPNAAYPRLSAVGNSYNNRTSSFWLKNASFLRLKNLELGYTLPERWTSSISLSKVKVFANAYNLWTLTGLENRDPELPHLMNGRVPNTKAVNFGLNIQF